MERRVDARAWKNPYYFLSPIRHFFRTRRLLDFKERYADCKFIADIGGDPSVWDVVGRSEGIAIVNIWVPDHRGSLPFILGDGCCLPFADKSVDLAFSNSAIEHVGDFAHQSKFAEEMLRVGKKVYCQTPCRWFPIDPHLSAFFLHWLPRSWLTPRLLRYFTLNGWLLGRSYEYDVTWLSKSQLTRIFPQCSIQTERFLGLPKSFIVTS
jgi:hypothetical protein